MGRTVLAFSQVIKADRERFRGFRRALSKEDQEAFDRLFDRAKMHTSAGVYMSNPWPMETILLSICMEHGKMIEDIWGKFKDCSSPVLDVVGQPPFRIIISAAYLSGEAGNSLENIAGPRRFLLQAI